MIQAYTLRDETGPHWMVIARKRDEQHRFSSSLDRSATDGRVLLGHETGGNASKEWNMCHT